MTSGSIFRACLLGLSCVGGALGATIAGYSNTTAKPVADEEGALAEQNIQYHTAHPRAHLASVPSPLTHQGTPSAFERYIIGIDRLSAALRDPQHDWKAARTLTGTSAAPDERNSGNTDFRNDVQKLFALSGTMKRFSIAMKELYSNGHNRATQENATVEAEANVLSRLHTAVTVAITELSRLISFYWQDSGEDEDAEEGNAMEMEDSMKVLVEVLEALASAHSNYTIAMNTHTGGIIEYSTPEVPATLTAALDSRNTSGRVHEYLPSEVTDSTQAQFDSVDWHENQRGLLQVAMQLKAFLGLESVEGERNDTVLTNQPTTILTTLTTTTTTTISPSNRESEPPEQPCLPPFQQIAYRMCILQEMQLKLSWSGAQEFCRERGAKLAEDMVVIKTRRVLNDLYGEDGTRTRWPVWVGGRRAGKTWIWEDGQQVPHFLWAPSEPRGFSRHLTPEGQCMMLDGYRRFYGASLPCQLRRRFICQQND